jgi:hypothetical protein
VFDPNVIKFAQPGAFTDSLTEILVYANNVNWLGCWPQNESQPQQFFQQGNGPTTPPTCNNITQIFDALANNGAGANVLKLHWSGADFDASTPIFQVIMTESEHGTQVTDFPLNGHRWQVAGAATAGDCERATSSRILSPKSKFRLIINASAATVKWTPDLGPAGSWSAGRSVMIDGADDEEIETEDRRGEGFSTWWQ